MKWWRRNITSLTSLILSYICNEYLHVPIKSFKEIKIILLGKICSQNIVKSRFLSSGVSFLWTWQNFINTAQNQRLVTGTWTLVEMFTLKWKILCSGKDLFLFIHQHNFSLKVISDSRLQTAAADSWFTLMETNRVKTSCSSQRTHCLHGDIIFGVTRSLEGRKSVFSLFFSVRGSNLTCFLVQLSFWVQFSF